MSSEIFLLTIILWKYQLWLEKKVNMACEASQVFWLDISNKCLSCMTCNTHKAQTFQFSEQTLRTKGGGLSPLQ